MASFLVGTTGCNVKFHLRGVKFHPHGVLILACCKYGNALEMDTEDPEHDHIENVKAVLPCVKKGSDLEVSALRRKLV